MKMKIQSILANNGNGSTNGSPISINGITSQPQPQKPVIERGASWSYNETRILLSLWGQDMVQRQLTNSKRTRHVWEKIADRIREHGFERTPDQVRTRVFNMIAEYRRILKNPSPERKKKCIFFDALHKIYQAKDTNAVKAALNIEEDYHIEPLDTIQDEENNHGVDTGDDENSGNDNEEVFAYSMSPSQTLSGTNGHILDNEDSMDENGPYKRFRSEAYQPLSSNQYQSVVAFDQSSSALLIDRMFNYLSKETEVMREWISLEKERFNRDALRRKEEAEREERREKSFLETLMKMQEQTFAFLAKQNITTVSSDPLLTSREISSLPSNPSEGQNLQDQLRERLV